MNTHITISDEEFGEIAQFLSGELKEPALSAFRENLTREADLSDKVEVVRLTLLGIKEAALSDDLKKWRLAGGETVIKRISSNRKWLFATLAGVAAMLVLILTFMWMKGKFRNNDEKLFSRFYHADAGLITSMGVSDSYDFDVAMIDYKSGNYTSAIAKWEGLLRSNEGNDTLNYFLGSSYLAMDKPKQAAIYFEKVIHAGGGVFINDGHWYLGLALLKEGDKAAAIRHIEMSQNSQKEKLLKELRK